MARVGIRATFATFSLHPSSMALATSATVSLGKASTTVVGGSVGDVGDRVVLAEKIESGGSRGVPGGARGGILVTFWNPWAPLGSNGIPMGPQWNPMRAPWGFMGPNGPTMGPHKYQWIPNGLPWAPHGLPERPMGAPWVANEPPNGHPWLSWDVVQLWSPLSE